MVTLLNGVKLMYAVIRKRNNYSLIPSHRCFSYLKEESFSFTVASSKNSINGGGNTPNFSNSTRWRWWTEWT